MHTRRFITLLIGAWAALVVTVVIAAAPAFQVVGGINIAPPSEAGRAIALLGESMTGQLFHYVAAETSRALLEKSGVMEIALLFVLSSFLFLQNYNKLATVLGGMLLLTAIASYFLLTPQIVVQGRLLDFRAITNLPGEHARLNNVGMLYGSLLAFRLASAAWIAGILLYRGPNSKMRRRRDHIDEIDDPKDSHIDG